MLLYNHQKKIIDEDPKRCGIFLGTGASKTRISLELAQGNILIICPKTQKEDGNWERENIKWHIYKDITVISKETFKRDHASLPAFETVIIDEAHTVLGVTPNTRMRNKRLIPKASQIFEAVHTYVSRVKPKRLYLVTATPARNPMSIWAAGILLGQTWKWSDWRRFFYVKLPMPGRDVFQPRKDAASKTLLAKYTRQIGYVGRLDDWFDVPEQTDKFINCPLDKGQNEMIKGLRLLYPDPLILIGKTHQIEQGQSKLEAIMDLLEEFPKVVIFARYLDQIRAINSYLLDKGIMTYVLTGETKDRKKLINEANNAERCAFIAQSSISTGYELPSMRCAIFASLDYSFVNYTQCRGRILRANALNKNLYVHLSSGLIDQAVLKCMQNHQDFEEKLYGEPRS